MSKKRKPKRNQTGIIQSDMNIVPVPSWMTHLHRTGNWRLIATWLAAHDRWLPATMKDFAWSMADADKDYQPSPKQMSLLISLRAGVYALIQWESMPVVDDEPHLVEDDDDRPRYLN